MTVARALVVAVALVSLTACGRGGGSVPSPAGAGAADLLAYRSELAQQAAGTTDCDELHDLALGGTARLADALGDGPAIPGLEDVAAEQLTHAGGLGLMLYGPDPTAPWARWGNAITVLDMHLAMSAQELPQGGEQPQDGEPTDDGATDLEAERVRAFDEDGIDPLGERYTQIGCTAEDEAAAVARHLGLPERSFQRDLAAFEAMSALIDTADDGADAPVHVTTLSVGDRRDFSILQRLLHGPALADDATSIDALVARLRAVAEDLPPVAAGDELEVPLDDLPSALAETARVVATDQGVCISVQLRETLAVASLDPLEPIVSVPRPGAFTMPTEVFADVDLPAACA